ncbi:MAG: hypothetical protein ACYC5X_04750 [Syntrophales bacterium]
MKQPAETTFRTAAGSILLIVLTGYAVMTLLWQSISLTSDLPVKDPVTIHEERIRQLKAFLPASGAVGYVTTVENDRIFADEKAFRNVEFLAQYVLTQYTLAPLIVRNSPEFPLVVGNFLDGPPAPGFLEKNGLVPVKDFGDGLILYRRGPTP